MRTTIHKLGGSIMGNGTLISNALSRIRLDDPTRKHAFVVSALSSSADKSTGTTTMLQRGARLGSIQDKLDTIKFLVKAHDDVYQHFGLSISSDTEAILSNAFTSNDLEKTIECGYKLQNKIRNC